MTNVSLRDHRIERMVTNRDSMSSRCMTAEGTSDACVLNARDQVRLRGGQGMNALVRA